MKFPTIRNWFKDGRETEVLSENTVFIRHEFAFDFPGFEIVSPAWKPNTFAIRFTAYLVQVYWYVLKTEVFYKSGYQFIIVTSIRQEAQRKLGVVAHLKCPIANSWCGSVLDVSTLIRIATLKRRAWFQCRTGPTVCLKNWFTLQGAQHRRIVSSHSKIKPKERQGGGQENI